MRWRSFPFRVLRAKRRGLAFTLMEVMIAVVLVAIALAPAISAIQMTRVAARSTSLEIIGQNLAMSTIELVRLNSYSQVAYGAALPASVSVASTINPLLEIPRQSGSSTGATQTTLPAGAPGAVSVATMNTFLSNWRAGTIDRASTVVTSSTNYYFYSASQINALSGYDSTPAGGTPVLDAKFAWAIYVNVDSAGATGGAIGYPIKHLVVVVKWTDPRHQRIQYAVEETYLSQACSSF